MDTQELRVLIIDDDDVDRMAVSRALKKGNARVVADEASDGPGGMEALRNNPYDCVILDYRLPGSDGLDVLKKVRAEGIRTPIIMLTRQEDEGIAVEMMKSGASDYLSKDRLSTDTLMLSLHYAIRSHQAEEELRESQERYTVAVNGANDGIWDWNLKANQIYFSPRWKSIIGFEDSEIGHSPEEWFSRVHPEDLERVKFDVEAHLAGRTSCYENEHRMLHKDGTYRWVHSRGLALRNESGKIRRMAGSQTDITERKLSEAERGSLPESSGG